MYTACTHSIDFSSREPLSKGCPVISTHLPCGIARREAIEWAEHSIVRFIARVHPNGKRTVNGLNLVHLFLKF